MISLNLNTVKTAWKVSKTFVIKNAPKILTIVGVTAMAGATVHAIAVSPKAKAEVDEIEQDEDLTHKEYIKKKTLTYLKYYWPEFLLVFGGGACVFGAQHINAKRIAAISTVLATQTDKLEKLENVIKTEDGEKKLRKYTDKAAQNDAKECAEGYDWLNCVYNTGKGSTLCFDPVGRRFFISDVDYITECAEDLSEGIMDTYKSGRNGTASLNKFYESFNLPELDGMVSVGKQDAIDTGINIGKDFGWKNRKIKLNILYDSLPNQTVYAIIGFQDGYEPRLYPDIYDFDGSDRKSKYSIDDDETDMKWR